MLTEMLVFLDIKSQILEFDLKITFSFLQNIIKLF